MASTNPNFVDDDGLLKSDKSARNGSFDDSKEFTNGTAAPPDVFDEDESDEKKGCWSTFKEYPKSVFCIVGNEFCERFSFYGMRAVLTLYLINKLSYGETDATVWYHAFVVIAYFSPIFGCILADGYIGKFHTILWVSLLYAAGNVILAGAAFFPKGANAHPAMDFVGLFVNSLGTGGIKPCVSAFGADQFKPGQKRLIETFFSVFYFSINAGSTISIFITPYLQTYNCDGEGTCYPLAFGVPAVLMLVSCFFFIVGSRWYVRNPPKENIIAEFCKVIYYAIKNKATFSIKRDNWVLHAMDDHSCRFDKRCVDGKKCYMEKLTQNVRAVLRLLIMYLPLPFFWMLYDQQGSKWVIQATQMDGIVGNSQVYAAQMSVVNPILIMIFIPIFSGIVYPVWGKFTKVTPLRKMVIGSFLAVAAFVISAVVQLQIDPDLPPIIKSGMNVKAKNFMPCPVTLTIVTEGGQQHSKDLQLYNPTAAEQNATEVTFNKLDAGLLNYTVTGECISYQGSYHTSSKNLYYLVVAGNRAAVGLADLAKPTKGFGEFKLNLHLMVDGYEQPVENVTFDFGACRNGKLVDGDAYQCKSHTDDALNKTYDPDSGTGFQSLQPGTWDFFFPNYSDPQWNNVSGSDRWNVSSSLHFQYKEIRQGGIFEAAVWKNETGFLEIGVMTIVGSNRVNIFWQLPQYLVITAAEIMFSITGLEFSYSQAPPEMKSVLQGVWLLAVAVGDLLIIVVLESIVMDSDAWLYLIFAGVMLVISVIFALLAHFWYTYVSYGRDDDDDDELALQRKKGDHDKKV